MLTFLNQPLLWGLGLIAVPVLIHLINMLRHRRVKWAAMEFLLASQKKHSTWIRLKELLLLLLRVAAVAAIVLIVARPRLDGALGKSLGDVVTHHVVLLDDTYSMSDRFAERNVFDAARDAVEQIALQALDESSAQTFTLLRASRAAPAGGSEPDLYSETVNSDLVMRDRTDRKLNSVLEGLRPTDLAAGPDALIRAAATLLKPNESEERIIYLVSDFRAKDWRESAELQSRLVALEKRAAQIYFINVADAERPNLAVTSLRPASGTIASGVHFFMQAEVRNFGRGKVDNVPLSIRTDGAAGGVVFLPQIEGGRADVVRFPVYFSSPGEHAVSVSLEPDAVEADNARYAVLDVPAELPVLVVDGTADGAAGRAVAEALAPPGPVRSGLDPQIKPPSFLNDAEANPLVDYRTVFLSNLSRLDEAAVRNLDAFVEAGGGACFVVGDKTDAAFFNQALYRDGAGPFPVPLDAERPLFRPVDGARTADILGSSHPVFKLFTLEQNTYLYDVTVNKYFGVRGDWTPELGAKSQTDVIAKFRNGAPLAAEKTLGKGRVVALLTIPVEPYSDWARNGSFVVTMQEMQSHLARRDDLGGDERRVGLPLVIDGDPNDFRPAAQVLPPLTSGAAAVTLQAVAGPAGLRWEFDDTSAAGFYRIERTRLDDTVSVVTLPMNVDPAEGELARFEYADLRQRLPDVRFVYRSVGSTALADSESGSSYLSTLLLYALAAVLLGEQALAYFASYHTPLKGAPA